MPHGFPTVGLLAAFDVVSALAVVVGVDAPVESGGDKRSPHGIHVGVHLGHESV